MIFPRPNLDISSHSWSSSFKINFDLGIEISSVCEQKNKEFKYGDYAEIMQKNDEYKYCLLFLLNFGYL